MKYAHADMEPRLEVRHLKLVAAVADVQSITRAAQRLHLTQSALSHQLHDAEEILGKPLFLRKSKRMVLTPAGEKLVTFARRALGELTATEEQIQGFDVPAGPLRLSTECYTCYHWLPGMLKIFQEKFPRVEVRIEVDATSKPVAALLQGKLDVAVISSEPRDRRIRLEPLFQDELVIVVAAQHRLARQKWIAPRDLADETILIYPPLRDSTLLKVLAPHGIQPRGVQQIQLTEAIIELVAAGMGIGFLARWAIAPKLASGEIVARPLTETGFHRQWSAAILDKQPQPEHLPQFLALLKRAIPGKAIAGVARASMGRAARSHSRSLQS